MSTYTGPSESYTSKQWPHPEVVLVSACQLVNSYTGLKYAMAHILVYVLVCDVLISECVTRSQLFRSTSNELLLCFSRTKMEPLPEVTGAYWLSMVKIL
jgi:hypothetical protein